MRRIALIAMTAVLLAACGADGGPSASPSTEPTAGIEPPILIPFTGSPPIWTISNEEFDRIIGGLSALYYPDAWERYGPVTERCRELIGTRPEGDLIGGNAAAEGCLRPYLEELGVGERALDLFFRTGILVWDAQAVGPFWMVYGTDYDAFGTEAFAPDYLFTPDGIFDLPDQFTSAFPPEGWEPLMAARDEALGAEAMRDIREAYGERFGISADDIAFWPYGETIDLYRPLETGTGWTVPFEWRLLGCHVCITPIIGRFELDATPDGSIEGVRFVGLCHDLAYAKRDPEDISIARGAFGLTACASGTPSPD